MRCNSLIELQTALERQHEEQAGDESLTLTDLLHIVLKHKWTLLIVILLACAVAGVRTLLSTPIYRSTVVLQIERVAPAVVRFNNDMDQYQGYVDEEMSQKTQYQLLKSESLAERVIDELKLDQSKPTSARLWNRARARIRHCRCRDRRGRQGRLSGADRFGLSQADLSQHPRHRGTGP